MRKLFLFLAIAFAFVIPTDAQPGPVATPRYLGRRAADPAACTVSNWYYNTVSNKFRYCSATNTWGDLGGAGGSGDVVGPASSTDNAIARFDLATGKLLQNSGAEVNDSGYVGVTGAAAVGSSTLEVPVLYNKADTNTGIGLHGSDNISIIAGGSSMAWTGVTLYGGNNTQFGWSSSANGPYGAAADTGLKRAQAGVIGATDGTNVTGIVPGVQFIVNSSDTTMGNVATAQSPFAAANDTLTVTGSTTYFFEAQYYLTTGATTHTTGTLFGGTATLTSIGYWAELWSVTDGTISTTAPSVLRVAAGTNTVLNATSTATGTTIRLKGVIRVNAGGTLIPQIQFSADPTGTILGKTNSFFRIWPAGTNTVTSAGPWS